MVRKMIMLVNVIWVLAFEVIAIIKSTQYIRNSQIAIFTKGPEICRFSGLKSGDWWLPKPPIMAGRNAAKEGKSKENVPINSVWVKAPVCQ